MPFAITFDLEFEEVVFLRTVMRWLCFYALPPVVAAESMSGSFLGQAPGRMKL